MDQTFKKRTEENLNSHTTLYRVSFCKNGSIARNNKKKINTYLGQRQVKSELTAQKNLKHRLDKRLISLKIKSY